MFIIDQNDHLIAADTADLERWGFADILEAVRSFREGSLRFEKEVGILLLPDDSSLNCEVETLDSLLGTWYLCRSAQEEAAEMIPAETPPLSREPEEPMQLLPEPEEEPETEAASSATAEEPSRETEAELEALLKLLPEEEAPSGSAAEEEIVPPLAAEEAETSPSALLAGEIPADTEAREEATPAEAPEEEPEETLPLLADEPEEEPYSLREETPAENPLREEAPLAMETEEPLSLEAPESQEPPIPLPETKEKGWREIEASFRPDLRSNAAHLDLGVEEYTALVKDFVHDSRQMQPNLLSSDASVRRETVSILKDAVILLQLRPIDRLLDLIESASPEERTEIADALDRMLGRLENGEAAAGPAPAAAEISLAEELPPAPEKAATPSRAPEEKTETVPAGKPDVSVDEFLEGVRPIPIEFSLQIAAEELNLPEDLVLEFITDFANQGHEHLPVLIDAYQKKELERLQKTAHMLKGAASNLRVEAMVENLYELQFDNEIERAPERIRKFAGQLMSLDNFLKQLNG